MTAGYIMWGWPRGSPKVYTNDKSVQLRCYSLLVDRNAVTIMVQMGKHCHLGFLPAPSSPGPALSSRLAILVYSLVDGQRIPLSGTQLSPCRSCLLRSRNLMQTLWKPSGSVSLSKAESLARWQGLVGFAHLSQVNASPHLINIRSCLPLHDWTTVCLSALCPGAETLPAVCKFPPLWFIL